ncbi:MAG TPA: plastocyanin/azurin family copper-binding protein [Longimicrobiales bacterium]
MTRNRSLAALLACALAALPALSCYSDRSTIVDLDGEGCEVPGSAIGPDRAIVFIRDFAFFPDTLRIAAGTRVTWVNCEDAGIEPHTSTADAGTWDSGLIAPGEAYSRTFTAAGSNGYFCEPHPFMRGAILVQ